MAPRFAALWPNEGPSVMTLVLNLEEAPAILDRVIDLDALKDVVVIVRGPILAGSRLETTSTPSWIFDDNDLVTWEDAEWQ
jgi:hypothetical protein